MFKVAFFTVAKTWKQPKCLRVKQASKDLCTMKYDWAMKSNEHYYDV